MYICEQDIYIFCFLCISIVFHPYTIAIGANNYCENITCTNSGFTLNDINEEY